MSVSSDSPLPTPPDADGLAALPDTVARRSGRADRSPAERSSVDGVPRVAATDGELLGLFTRNGDGEALDRLIDRHAAMVWQVCRQTVRRREDAEDAFQATFLQLTKSARAIRSSDSAAGWLYRVAHRTALRARKRQAARREESLALDPTAPTETAFPDLAKKQTAGVLLEELRGLPTQYQTPLVLRYLEGQSRRAIADQTDTTVAAVQGRLARGKRLLRRRLLRRGVSLSASIGAVAVAGRRADAASAGPPAPLVAQAAANSTALATGGSVAASVAAMTLYREGVRAMLLASIGKPAGVFAGATLAMLLSIGVAGEGAVGVPAAETPQPPAAAGGSSGDAVTLDASVADAGEGPVAAAVELDSGEIETDSAAPAAKPTTAAVDVEEAPAAAAADTPGQPKSPAEQLRDEWMDRLRNEPELVDIDPKWAELMLELRAARVELRSQVDSFTFLDQQAARSAVLVDNAEAPRSELIEAESARRKADAARMLAELKVQRVEQQLAQLAQKELRVERARAEWQQSEMKRQLDMAEWRQAEAVTAENQASAEAAQAEAAATEEAAATVTPTPPRDGARAALARPLGAAGWRLVDTPLEKFADWLEAKTGVDVYLDEIALDELGMNPDERVSVDRSSGTLAEALDQLLEPLTLRAVPEGGAIRITGDATAQTLLEPRVYAVEDLVGPDDSGAAGLIEAIQQMVEPSTWAAGGGGDADLTLLQGGVLSVRQTDRGHRRLVEFLDKVRVGKRRVADAQSTAALSASGFSLGTLKRVADEPATVTLPAPKVTASAGETAVVELSGAGQGESGALRAEASATPDGRVQLTLKTKAEEDELSEFPAGLPDAIRAVAEEELPEWERLVESVQSRLMTSVQRRLPAALDRAISSASAGGEKVDPSATMVGVMDEVGESVQAILTEGGLGAAEVLRKASESDPPADAASVRVALQLLVRDAEQKLNELLGPNGETTGPGSPDPPASSPAPRPTLNYDAAMAEWNARPPEIRQAVERVFDEDAAFKQRTQDRLQRIFEATSASEIARAMLGPDGRPSEPKPGLSDLKITEPADALKRIAARMAPITKAWLEAAQAEAGDDADPATLERALRQGRPAMQQAIDRLLDAEVASAEARLVGKPIVTATPTRTEKGAEETVPDESIDDTAAPSRSVVDLAPVGIVGDTGVSLDALPEQLRPAAREAFTRAQRGFQRLARRVGEMTQRAIRLANQDSERWEKTLSEIAQWQLWLHSGWNNFTTEAERLVARMAKAGAEELPAKLDALTRETVEGLNGLLDQSTLFDRGGGRSTLSKAGDPVATPNKELRSSEADGMPSAAGLAGLSIDQLIARQRALEQEIERLNRGREQIAKRDWWGDPNGPALRRLQAAEERINEQLRQRSDELANVTAAVIERWLANDPAPLASEPVPPAAPPAPAETTPPAPPRPPAPPANPFRGPTPKLAVYLDQLRATATYQAAPGDIAATMERKLRQYHPAFRHGGFVRQTPVRVVVGRVSIPKQPEASFVTAQMEILPGGWFLTALADDGKPLSFRGLGLMPLDAMASPRGDGASLVSDLGRITMQAAPKAERRNVQFRVVDESGRPIDDARVSVRAATPPVNSLTGGYEPRSAWAEPLRLETVGDGSFDAGGWGRWLAPIEHVVSVSKDGYLTRSRTVDLADGDADLGDYVLEKPRRVEISYVVLPRPAEGDDGLVTADRTLPIDPARTVTLAAGDKFVAAPTKKRGRYDFRLDQRNGRLTIDGSYGPDAVKRLGTADRLPVTPGAKLPPLTMTGDEEDTLIESGGVYLVDQRQLDRRILMHVRMLGGGPGFGGPGLEAASPSERAQPPAAAGGTSPPLFEAEADERARLLAAEVETDPTGLRIDGGAYGERNVRYGHSVRDLQKALNRQVPIETLRSAGGPLRIDGDYGPRTALFVKAFQRFQELPDTGFADAKTRERLGLTPAGRPPVERGPGLEVFAPAAPREPSPFAGSASNDAAIAKLAQIDGPGRGRYPEANRRYGHSVKLLQASLILSLGHTGLAVDGDYGPKTEEYVKRFQRSEGLRSTGFADPDTRERLGLTDPPLAVLRQRLASRRANERADAERQVDELATEIAARERYVETLFRRLRERTRPTAALR